MADDRFGGDVEQVRSFSELLVAARGAGPKRIAIAAAHDKETMIAAQAAQEQGIATSILVGDQATIEGIARDHSIDLSALNVIHEPDPRLAAQRIMKVVSLGQAEVAMKGRMETGSFLRAALDKRIGLCTERLLTHVGVFEVPGFDRLILITDGGVVLHPTLEQKVEIIQNAIEVAHRLGVAEPKIALLSATEEANPKIPSSVDAAELTKMRERWQGLSALVDGPFTLDHAISPESAAISGIHSPVAGRADVLIVPGVEAGNIMAKGITYFAGGVMAGVVVGAKAPLVIGSRADPWQTKLACMALGGLLA